jgi:UDP-glucose 4-epimerase
VKAAARSASPIRHVPYADAYAAGFEDMQRRVPDLTKLERLTGRRPRTKLDRTIEDVLADQRSRTGAGRK